MEPFNEVSSDSQNASDEFDSFGIHLEAGHCYLFFAVGGRTIPDLDAALVDPDGEKVKDDTGDDNWPSFMHCATQTGRHRYIISVASGGGTYHYQVWQRSGR